MGSGITASAIDAPDTERVIIPPGRLTLVLAEAIGVPPRLHYGFARKAFGATLRAQYDPRKLRSKYREINTWPHELSIFFGHTARGGSHEVRADRPQSGLAIILQLASEHGRYGAAELVGILGLHSD